MPFHLNKLIRVQFIHIAQYGHPPGLERNQGFETLARKPLYLEQFCFQRYSFRCSGGGTAFSNKLLVEGGELPAKTGSILQASSVMDNLPDITVFFSIEISLTKDDPYQDGFCPIRRRSDEVSLNWAAVDLELSLAASAFPLNGNNVADPAE